MSVTSAADAPVCLGCGLASPPAEIDRHGGICWECFDRREAASGQGATYIVTTGRTVHDNPLCPGARGATRWYLTRAECWFYSRDEWDACGLCLPEGFQP